MLSIIKIKKINFIYSRFVAFILRLNGVEVGPGFHIEGIPRFKINGISSNIKIGSNVSIFGGIDIRNRENGKIIIGDHVRFDGNVRIVSARDGKIEIGDYSVIGPNTIINGGGNISIGKYALFSKNISINSNEHMHARSKNILDQGFTFADVILKDDVWLGANVCVNKGVVVEKGTIVGANAVVTKNTEEYSIYAGVPAKKIGERG